MDAQSWTVLAIALCLIPCIAVGAGIAAATGRACEAVAKQPEAGGRIMTLMILGFALAEATAIYGLLMAIMLYSTL